MRSLKIYSNRIRDTKAGNELYDQAKSYVKAVLFEWHGIECDLTEYGRAVRALTSYYKADALRKMMTARCLIAQSTKDQMAAALIRDMFRFDGDGKQVSE